MRLTDIACMNDEFYYIKDSQKITDGQILDKLGRIEDIEEELGIDLITLSKALKKGIYIKINRLIKPARIMNADIKHKTLSYITIEDWNEEWLNFINYGETWALTKEELEKGE